MTHILNLWFQQLALLLFPTCVNNQDVSSYPKEAIPLPYIVLSTQYILISSNHITKNFYSVYILYSFYSRVPTPSVFYYCPVTLWFFPGLAFCHAAVTLFLPLYKIHIYLYIINNVGWALYVRNVLCFSQKVAEVTSHAPFVCIGFVFRASHHLTTCCQ